MQAMRHTRNRSDFKNGISPELAISSLRSGCLTIVVTPFIGQSIGVQAARVEAAREFPDVLSMSLQTEASLNEVSLKVRSTEYCV